MKLMEPFGAAIADLPLRPLLFTGVTAASACIFCYLFKRGDGKKPTADPQDKTPPEAACDKATEVSLLQPKEVPQYQECKQERESHSLLQAEIKELKISLEEAEEKHQNAVESITQMEVEKYALQDKIETLQKTWKMEMGILLHQHNKECNKLKNERERELESHNLLKIKYKEMEESVAHKEEFLKISLAEAEEKHQNAVESITQMEVEKSALQDKIVTLQKTVQEMGNLLIESNKECDNLTNVSLAEAEKKHQNAVESITQLEVEKSALQDQIETLQKTVQEMGNLLIESNKECDNLQNECEQELETHNLLKIKCKEMEESLAQKEELLKVSLAEAEKKHQNAVESITQLEVSLAEAEKKHQNAVESITQLEVEKSALQDQIETLEKTVQEMGNLLIESNKECDNLQNEHERELETHNLLKIKCKEMEKSLAHKEELLKVSLAEAEKKHQNAVESITQLEVEKSALQDKIETLQKTVQEMGNLLIERNKECDNLQNEHEQMMETHNILQATNKDIEENLQHCKELLMVSLAEAEEKHQNAVESITQLEVEKSALQGKIETLEKTVQEMGNLCFESNKECDNLTNVSLADAEEKHQNAVESITQLEVEKSALQDKKETLEKTVQETGNLLIESNKECDNLQNERERELETHNLLKIKCKEMEESVAHREELLKEHEQMMETYNILQATNKDIEENLQHCEELLMEHKQEVLSYSFLQDQNDILTISLAEAEGKHRNAVESITCLDDEKSALQDQIETLEMGILSFESNKECDNLANVRFTFSMSRFQVKSLFESNCAMARERFTQMLLDSSTIAVLSPD
ncbi:hypothetical protein HF521_022445 [Silurus meridionalis]|uniref:Uncharacterized protein n=1 Tax=Silurus meridionalis TaxID=175797 RepID=A0A8T0B911_SILME|nr:hypothetical protein HF521_022445 [Silurus meridionalis]